MQWRKVKISHLGPIFMQKLSSLAINLNKSLAIVCVLFKILAICRTIMLLRQKLWEIQKAISKRIRFFSFFFYISVYKNSVSVWRLSQCNSCVSLYTLCFNSDNRNVELNKKENQNKYKNKQNNKIKICMVVRFSFLYSILCRVFFFVVDHVSKNLLLKAAESVKKSNWKRKKKNQKKIKKKITKSVGVENLNFSETENHF